MHSSKRFSTLPELVELEIMPALTAGEGVNPGFPVDALVDWLIEQGVIAWARGEYHYLPMDADEFWAKVEELDINLSGGKR